MTKETITRIKLIASENMVLTNGETYGKIIFLSENANPNDWHEITEQEYDEILKANQEKVENEEV